jgi:hypothetical protein
MDFEALIAEANVGGAAGSTDDILNSLSRDLVPGEKAPDAVDYENISDDDLPEEEEASTGIASDEEGMQMMQSSAPLQAAADEDGEEEDGNLDYLFGPDPDMEPAESREDSVPSNETPLPSTELTAAPAAPQDDPDDDGDDGDQDPEYREQLALFKAAGRGGHDHNAPALPKTSPEEFERVWPNFEPDKPPRFFSLVPRKRAYFVPKVPLKEPKVMKIDKINLDIAVDQEKSFRLPATAVTLKNARQLEDEPNGLIYITDDAEEQRQSDENVDLENLDSFDDHEMIGNVSWNDLTIACENWDLPDAASESTISITKDPSRHPTAMWKS